MAVTFDNSDTRKTTGGTTVSFNYTCTGSNRLLLTNVRPSGGSVAINSATYGGVSMAQLASNSSCKIFGLTAPTSGPNTLSHIFASYEYALINTASFAGVDQTTSTGTAVTNSGTNASPTTGSVTCPSNGMVYGGEQSDYASGSAPSITAGTTTGAQRDSGSGFTWAGGYRSSTGAVSWSIGSSVAWYATGIPINAAGGATATTTVFGSHPTSGAVNAASTNISISLDADPAASTIVTPHSDKAGTFSPTTLTFAPGGGGAAQTVTFTPAVSGVHSISTTNNQSLSNATPYNYTVQPEASIPLTSAPSGGSLVTGQTSLKWAWWDFATPDLFTAAPTDKGAAETTDGSGVITVPLPNSTKTNGQIGWLLVTNSDGTTSQSPAAKVFAGPVAVT